MPTGVYERKPQTDKQKEGYKNVSNALKNKPKSDLHRQHLSESKKGKPVSQKCLNNLKIGWTLPKSESHRAKIGAAHKGKIVSEESKQKMKISQNLVNQNPEVIKHKQDAQKKYIENHPEKRDNMRDIQLKRFKEHPELKDEISKRNKILLNTQIINSKMRKPKSDLHKKHLSESRIKLFKTDPNASKRLSEAQKKSIQRPEVKEHMKISQLKRWTNTTERERMRDIQLKRYEEHPELRIKSSERAKIILNKPNVKARMIQGMNEANKRPDVKENRSIASKIAMNRPEVKEKLSNSIKLAMSNPEVKERMIQGMNEANKRPDVKENRSIASKKSQNRPDVILKKQTTFGLPEVKERMSQSQRKSWETPLIRTKRLESIQEVFSGGFWYGNVNYNERKQYCEKWNRDLWNRIDTFQNYKSILSDKTKDDNNGHALSRHHVYWQEKACCVWDEDTQGYYAMINIGTRKNHNWFKYYIDGDPNKFVLLTRSEHAKVAKDKIKWIKIFEELIQNKYNGKCYYTKNEYKLLSDNIL